MDRFLFVFGYESPSDARENLRGGDAESSNAVWVQADHEDVAIEKGRRYAEEFVAKLYREEKAHSLPSWTDGNFARWISKRPLDEFSALALESFDEI
jgi:hypothetical protein